MLSLYIQPLLVPKGEYIVRKGDIGEEVRLCNTIKINNTCSILKINSPTFNTETELVCVCV